MDEPKEELTIAQELEQAEAAVEAAKADLNDQVELLQIAETERDEAKAELETLQAKVAELETENAERIEEVKELESELAEATEKNAEQAKALEHPAYENATTGGDPVEDGGEPAQEVLVKQYNELKGAKKTAFWRKHKNDLLATAGGNN